MSDKELELLKLTQKGKNPLVINVSCPLIDLEGHIRQLMVPIRKLNPETRIIYDLGIYAGGFAGLYFHKRGISGEAYIRFLRSLEEGNLSEQNLLFRMKATLFGNFTPNDRATVEYEGKRYVEEWRESTLDGRIGIYSQRLFNLSGGNVEEDDFKKELKTRVADRRQLILSDELLTSIFNPLISPVV